MDCTIQNLRRQAYSGDEQAGLRLAYAECRAGEHILRDDQIIIAENWQHAKEDAGCCQCGQELYDARQLCGKGNHHWYNNVWTTELGYRCVRPGITLLEQRELGSRISKAYQERNIELAFQLEQESRSWESHPYVYLGCKAVLQAYEACARGLHFLHIIPEGRVCTNPSCNYSEADACQHTEHGCSIRRNVFSADNREVARCDRCQQTYYDGDICAVFGHQPDPRANNPCIRSDCSEHQAGVSLYLALAIAARAGCQLKAVCRENGNTVAEASGWNQRLKALGIKKPKKGNVRHTWGHRHQVVVRHRREPLLRLGRGQDYTQISEKLKTFWAGNWYPLFQKKES